MPSVLKVQAHTQPITVSLFNEATGIPFTRFFTTPIHPGIQIGTEFDYRRKQKSRLFQSANLCYYYHNHLSQGIGINSELGYEYRFKFGLALEALIGIGYMHTFATTEEFSFKDGQYVKKRDNGNARLYPSISFDIGYYIKRSKGASPKIFIRYQSWVEYPYSPDFIPLMTHINLHLGASFFLHSKGKKHE